MARIGLQLPNFTYGVPDDQIFDRVVEYATVAEQAGAESLWVMDHFYQLPALGGAAQPILEGYTTLGGLAARTERVQLGTLVTGVTYRNPAMLAKIVTTLDVMSKGRAILGIGAAWHDLEHTGLGFDYPSDRERLDRLEEAVQICRAMFTEEAPSFTGRYYRIHEARNIPRPIRPGGPPIMIGGGGEKRTLRLVAQYADMCNVTGDVEQMRHKIEVLHKHCVDVGRDPADVTVTRMSTLMLTESADQTEQTMSFLRSAAGDDAARTFDVGEKGQVAERLAQIVDAGTEKLIFNMPMAPPDQVGAALEWVIGELG